MLGRLIYKGMTVSHVLAATAWYRLCGRKDTAGPPVFILGCGHSGTSVLLAILSAHPNIFAVPFESRITLRKPGNAERLLRFFDLWAIAQSKCRWAEKTPRHVDRIDRLLELRPNSRILFVIRDGRDVAFSMQRRYGDLELGIRRWVADNEAGRRYWEHPQVMVVHYESLIKCFEETMKNVFAYIGEEMHPYVLEYHRYPKKWYSRNLQRPVSRSGENHKRFRNWQINQPLFDGRGKWKRLRLAERLLIERHGGYLLKELGYTTSSDWVHVKEQ